MRKIKEILFDWAKFLNEKGNNDLSDSQIKEIVGNEIQSQILLTTLLDSIKEKKEINGKLRSTTKAFFIFCYIILKEDPSTGQIIWNNFVKKQFELIEFNDQSCYIAARSHGKSFVAFCLYPIFKAFIRIGFEAILCSNIPKMVKRNFRVLKRLIDTNELLLMKKKSENLRDLKWTESEIEYNNGYIETISMGTTPRSAHVDYVAIDDPLRDDKKMTNEYILNFVQGAIRLCILRKKGKMAVSGTPQHEGDLFHTLMRKTGSKTKICSNGEISEKGFCCDIFPAITNWEKKELLVPEIYDWDQLMKERASIGEYRFQRELMVNCISFEGSLIGRSLFLKCCSEIDVKGNPVSMLQVGAKDKKYIITMDCATSDALSADYAAFTVWELCEDGKMICRHLWHEKGYSINDPDGMDDDQIHIGAKLSKDFNNAICVIETNSPGISLKQGLEGLGVECVGRVTGSNKVNEIVDYIEAMKNGNVIFPSDPEDEFTLQMLEKIKNEHLNFGSKKKGDKEVFEALAGHDDIFDSCFPEGHLVKTDKGYKDISKIKEGDFVLTHKNRYKKVVKTNKRFINEKILEFNVSGIPERIRVTKNHPFLVSRYGSVHHSKYRFNLPDYFENSFEWIKAKDLKPKTSGLRQRNLMDLIIVPKKELINNTPFSDLNGFERFIGLYLAEGSCSHHGIALAFHVKEKELIDFCLDFLKRNGFNCNTQIVDNCCRVYAQRMILKNYFKRFGKSVDMCMPDDLVDSLDLLTVHGWLEGDGHLSPNGFVGTSISRKLVFQMKDILFRNKIICNIHLRQRGWNTFPNSKPIYAFTLNKINTKKLFGISSKSKRNTGITHHKGHFMASFNSEEVSFKGLVYNLQVEDDESYSVNGIKVHNCYFAWSYAQSELDDGVMPIII